MLAELFRSRDRTEWLDPISQPPEPPARGNGVDLYDFEEPNGARSEVGLDSSGNWRRLAVASGEGGSFPTSLAFQPREGSRYRGKIPTPTPPAPVDVRTLWHCAVTTMPSEAEALMYPYQRARDGAFIHLAHSGSSWGYYAEDAGLSVPTFVEVRAEPGDRWSGGKPVAVDPASHMHSETLPQDVPRYSEWFSTEQMPAQSGYYELRDEEQCKPELVYFAAERGYWGRLSEGNGELEVRSTPLTATWRGHTA